MSSDTKGILIVVRPIPAAPTPESLEDELATLRKGPGLTIERLRDAGSVIKACHDPSTTEPPIETIYERVLSALRVVAKIQEGQALWAAYGLDGGQNSDLQDRRRRYGKQVGKQPNTLAGWENKAIRELALRLLNRYHGAPPLPTDLPIPHGGYYMPYLQVVTHIKDRRFVAQEQTRTVIALVDGADHFVYGSYDPSSVLDEPVGCTIEPPRTFDRGVLHKLTFGTALNRGEAHTFRFRETVSGDADAEPPTEDLAGQTFESPTKLFGVAVKFEGRRPQTIWGYHQLHYISRPGEPEDGIPLTVPDSGVVTLQLNDLLGGLASGIAWRWE
ncbi:hypothetical protein [Nocardia farcinica]|uniref:hypothetical protein n=1 Tax=Nocardia farcinica TaxID=37329 RepID=UPI00245577EF|nr:hypothetical protein [Nocardia farcinica]